MRISYILPITQATGTRLIDTQCALKYLNKTFDSIFNQSIPNWELIVVIDDNLKARVMQIYSKLIQNNCILDNLYHPESKDVHNKIRFVSVKTNNSAIACNRGLEIAKGQYIATIQAGDMLAEFTTYELIKCLIENSKAQFIYTDHDHVDLQGIRIKPFFKPGLSPDLLYCQNYINNLVLIKKVLLRKIGGWNKVFNAAYDYELNLKAISNLIKLDRPNPKLLGNQSPIKHISQIMYHQRVNLRVNLSNKVLINIRPKKADEDMQSQQGLVILQKFFKKERNNVTVKQIKPKLYHHHWAISKPEPLVSLIIPTRDGYDILRSCIESILKKTNYKNYEILIIDNQTIDKQALEYMEALIKSHKNISIHKHNKPFNYSAIINYAVTKANGSVIGLINNDTEVITHEWLTEMVSHAIRPEIGAVGAMLYYPDGTIQHGGVVLGMNGVADHAFKSLKNNKKNDYFNYLSSVRNPKAVTAAALVIRKKIFNNVNGLDQINLKIAFNDVDLCLNTLKLGSWNLWTPHSELIHHESKTRKTKSSEIKEGLFLKRKHHIKTHTYPCMG